MAEKIKITFLGTGSAVPTARRNHPAVLLQYKDENILFDCGEGTQRQFRKAKMNPCKITKIFISHWHGDHVLGLSGLLQTLMFNGYNQKLEIYGPKGTKEKVAIYLETFEHKGDKLDLSVFEVKEGIAFENEEFYIESLPMDHDAVCNAYSFVIKEKRRLDKKKIERLKLPNSPLMGKLLEGKTVEIGGKKIDGSKLVYVEPERRFSYVVDTRVNSNIEKISKGADLLVAESTYSATESETAFEYGHMTSKDIAKIAKKAKVKNLALIHLSQRYENLPKLILGEAKEIFNEVFVPEDLDKFEI